MAPTIDKQHSRYSISQASRWNEDACPGSVPFSETLDPMDPTDDMIRGTRLHHISLDVTLTDILVKGVPEADARKAMRATMTTSDDYDSDDYEELDGFVGRVLADREKYRPPRVLIETRVTLDKSLELFGTLDVGMRMARDAALVRDLKGGRFAVEAKGNLQIGGYMAALSRQYGPFKRGLAIIDQPYGWSPDGSPERVWEMTREDIEYCEDKLIRSARKISKMSKDDPSSWGKLKTGDWCRTCPCAGVCPALAIHTEPARGVIEPAVVEEAALAVFEGASIESVIAERVGPCVSMADCSAKS